MGRLLAIDFGRKRCGIAVTDPLQICANGLATVRTCDLSTFVRDYCAKEQVDEIVVGKPTTLRGEPSKSTRYLTPAINALHKLMPEMKFTFFDERFTSAIAHKAMLDGGLKKTDRQDKALVDKIAATIILTDYLQSKR